MIFLFVTIFSLFATGIAENSISLIKRCGENEKWYDVHGGCDPTCDAPDRQCRGRVSGCFCLPDHVRDEYGECIPKYWCDYLNYPDKRCGYNEKWYDEHGGCDPTCDAPNRQCRGQIAGCFCLQDYVRNEYGICIPHDECDNYYKPRFEISNLDDENKCYGRNEEWDWCGCSDYTCENPPTKTKVCISCVPGCYCKEGFARYSNGECIDIDLCRNCPKNEEYSMCRKGCDGTCRNRYPECPGCVGGCVCKEGYVRSYYHMCIPYESCFY